MSANKLGWNQLLDGYPWFEGKGHFPLAAYSEFMPPPRLGRSPYGATDLLVTPDADPFVWRVSEFEEEYELRPGLEHLAGEIIQALTRLAQGKPVYPIGGHQHANLRDNPYWPDELASATTLTHERFVILMSVALSRTQDDTGRIRWTLFGSSEQGPERAFWKGFYTAPDQEWTQRDSRRFILQILNRAYGEKADDADHLKQLGFRVLPTKEFPADSLPAWTKPFILNGHSSLDDVRYLLTFRPFRDLPAAVRRNYLDGKLNLLPCPQSLIFWGMPTYRRLQRNFPFAMQIPLVRLAERKGGFAGLRVPQSGWLHDPHPDLDPDTVQMELVRNTYVRTNRWNRTSRYDSELALNPRSDKMSRVLFSTDLEVVGLYDKPIARNSQIWTRTFDLLLDGPNSTKSKLRRVEKTVIEGGLFGYRFAYPAMRVGEYEIYWQRPLVAFSTADGSTDVLFDGPTGYFTAYRADAPDLSQPVELWPRLLRRETYLSALHNFESEHDHYRHQTALNILSLLDSHQLLDHPLSRSLARHLLRIPKHDLLDDWFKSLRTRASNSEKSKGIRDELETLIESSDSPLPEPVSFGFTATRRFEEAWWKDIAALAHGQYINKDNADVVLDPPTTAKLVHHRRDLDALGEYLIARHRQAIAEAGMEGQAFCGELPFQWRTDYEFSGYGGWLLNQEDQEHERDILVIIPGKNRGEAIVMADHYDTAYMEDQYEKSHGGSGARLAAAGADDNHSATSTLLQAAPIYLKLAKEGRLERDVWLLHLTGEEFPADCMGARQFSQMLVEGRLRLRHSARKYLDLSATRVVGLLVMDMIGHNRDDDQDVFQISPGKSAESLRLAEQAHIANMIWNARAQEWNQLPDRRGKGRGQRSSDAITLPAIARHPLLHGEVRTIDDPQSSLYNTDGQIFSDVGVPVILFMENYDINRKGYHDSQDTLANVDLDYGSAVAAIAIETITRLATDRLATGS